MYRNLAVAHIIFLFCFIWEFQFNLLLVVLLRLNWQNCSCLKGQFDKLWWWMGLCGHYCYQNKGCLYQAQSYFVSLSSIANVILCNVKTVHDLKFLKIIWSSQKGRHWYVKSQFWKCTSLNVVAAPDPLNCGSLEPSGPGGGLEAGAALCSRFPAFGPQTGRTAAH